MIAEIPGALAQAAADAVVPQQIDPTTTLVRVEADGMTLIYHYELQELGVTKESLDSLFSTTNLPGICGEPDMVSTMRHGVTFRYEWTTPDRPTPWVIEVTEDDCGALG
ncbi:hypothetical protein [Brevundimonas sp.]|uniref:hypothetical protein n=1 Tax=Brevundimonas sp. TaxID=1871086 RepID=UPI0028AAB582|nr:hypothetical protein [Brevundimonas sp.]